MVATLTPLAGALTSIAIGILIGLGIAALLSHRMHRADRYRLRRLRNTMRTAAYDLEDAYDDPDTEGRRAAYRLRQGLEVDRSLADEGGAPWQT